MRLVIDRSFLCGAFGGLCWAYAKRWKLRDNLARQPNDARAPVIYLRSFHVDRRLARRALNIGRFVSVRTEEEQLVEALREIGPIIAIGRPGERFPRLSAQRIYVGDKDWQQQVLSWFKLAAVVVIQVPSNPTRGVTWEIDQSLNLVALDRLVFLVSRSSQSLDWLNQKLRDHGSTVGNMTKLHRAPYGTPFPELCTSSMAMPNSMHSSNRHSSIDHSDLPSFPCIDLRSSP